MRHHACGWAAALAFVVAFVAVSAQSPSQVGGEIAKLKDQIALANEDNFKCGVVVAWCALKENPDLGTNAAALQDVCWRRWTNALANATRSTNNPAASAATDNKDAK